MAHSVRLRSAQTALEGVTMRPPRGSVALNSEKTWRHSAAFGALTSSGIAGKGRLRLGARPAD